MQRIALVLCCGVFALSSANAQEYSKFTFDFFGGFTVPVGATANYTNWGWNAGGGAGFNFTSRLGIMVDLGYDSLGLNNGTVTALGIPGGQVNVFHATLDPVFHLTPGHRYDLYVTAGGGEFHTWREFSSATAGPTNAYIPSLGFPASAFGPVPVPASYIVNKPGFDVGAGVSMGAIAHGKFFAEAHWDHVFLNGGHLDYVPVSFGFRW